MCAAHTVMVFHGNARGYGMVNKVVLGRAALSDLAVWYTNERMCADEGVWILNECVLLWLLMVAGYNWMINVLTKTLIYYQFFAYFLCIWKTRRYILSYILTAVYFLNFAACFSKLFCTQYICTLSCFEFIINHNFLSPARKLDRTD